MIPPKTGFIVFDIPALGGVELVAGPAPSVGVAEVWMMVFDPDTVVDVGISVLVEPPIGGAVEVPTATPLIDKSRGTPYPKQRSSANWAVTVANVNYLVLPKMNDVLRTFHFCRVANYWDLCQQAADKLRVAADT